MSSGSGGTVAEARAELRRLGTQKKSIEEEIGALVEVLTTPGGPGLKGNLKDSEGFPRADIDVHLVLTQRNKVACLQTDHQTLMRRIELLMPAAFGGGGTDAGTASAPPGVTAPPAFATAADAGTLPADGGVAAATGGMVPAAPVRVAAATEEYLPPFAVVDELAAGSPADDAVLRVGDELVSLGELNARTLRAAAAAAAGGGLLQPLGALVCGSEGRALQVTALRRGGYERLTLTPRRWAGQGLLGCHITPL
jgi:26S proteasome non-ATPase regulatory subunit 9